MRLFFPFVKRYLVSSELDDVERHENSELLYPPTWSLVPRAPRRGGGGGSSGGSSGSGSSGGGSNGSGSYEGNGSAGGSTTGVKGGSSGYRANVSFGDAGGQRHASSYGAGGGPPVEISFGPFRGRLTGGGTRIQIYGTSRYASGYTYNDTGALVSGRGFPFGYWPVYIPFKPQSDYYGYREYGPASNPSRPGGAMEQALVRYSAWPDNRGGAKNNTWAENATASYNIVGDKDSVTAVMDALETNSTVHMEQAVQYYCASSFMLALTSYHNPANLPSRAPRARNATAPPLSADASLPVGTDGGFLKCLNETIGASIPIMDAPPAGRSIPVTVVVVCTVVGGLILFFFIFLLLKRVIDDYKTRRNPSQDRGEPAPQPKHF